MPERKIISSVHFPHGNRYEGSPCLITYSDGSTENTMADTYYQRIEELKMTTAEVIAIVKK